MKILDKTDETVTIHMTHDQSLMFVALIRESCAGTPMSRFEERVGYPRKDVMKVVQELNPILREVDITE